MFQWMAPYREYMGSANGSAKQEEVRVGLDRGCLCLLRVCVCVCDRNCDQNITV